MRTKTAEEKRIRRNALAKCRRVHIKFYQECIKEGMIGEDVDTVIAIMFYNDKTGNQMGALKACKQRNRNIAGRKAAETRCKNTRARARARARAKATA